MSIIVEIAIDPIGTCSSSVGDLISLAVKTISGLGLKYQVGPMGTSFELDSLSKLGIVLSTIHEELYRAGVKRIVTTIRIDDRRDKDETMEYKVKRVTDMI